MYALKVMKKVKISRSSVLIMSQRNSLNDLITNYLGRNSKTKIYHKLS